jgi:transcriptional regulator with XRE-family HTH domain
MIRSVGSGDSMRQVGERIGVPAAAATVSQIEKGERALKEPKIADWAKALNVREADLLELWQLSQGEIVIDGRRVFYTEASEALGNQPFCADIDNVLRERPDLERTYRLAARIAAVLRRLVPHVMFEVEPDDLGSFYDERWETTRVFRDEAEEYEAVRAAFVPLPWIRCYSREVSGPMYGVGVPVLTRLTPVTRRRGKSIEVVQLDDLIRALTGPERERVRGYVDAIVEQRVDANS